MALDAHQDILYGHAVAVIAHTQALHAASCDGHVTSRRAGVQRVLQQLLQGARWTVDDLASRNLTRQGRRKNGD